MSFIGRARGSFARCLGRYGTGTSNPWAVLQVQGRTSGVRVLVRRSVGKVCCRYSYEYACNKQRGSLTQHTATHAHVVCNVPYFYSSSRLRFVKSPGLLVCKRARHAESDPACLYSDSTCHVARSGKAETYRHSSHIRTLVRLALPRAAPVLLLRTLVPGKSTVRYCSLLNPKPAWS